MPNDWLIPWLCGVLGSFLLGAVPFGVIIARAKGINIREHGSKNIGATNVGRVLGRRWGLLCFVLDALKGLLPTVASGALMGMFGRLDQSQALLGAWLALGLAAVLGHMFSPFVGFKGGKGVATGFGAVLGFFPWLTIPGVLALCVWGAALALWRYVSLASCLAAVALAACTPLVYPVSVWLRIAERPADATGPVWLTGYPFSLAACALGALVIWRHRGNIARLRAGTEAKIGGKHRAPSAQISP